MREERLYEFVLPSPTEDPLPPYSSSWARDIVEKKPNKRWNWGSPSGWVSSYATAPGLFSELWDNAWAFRNCRPSSKQFLALSFLVSFGILPLILLGVFVPGSFPGVFGDKFQTCGDFFGTPANATVTGIEKLFVLDNTFGLFTFSQAKTIDIVWDVAIGRGVQLLAWWVGYAVFSDALLRAIERHPASFEIFQRIALEGPSLLSLWSLLKEQWHAKSKRTRALFIYIWLSTIYITSIPMLLSAMTGYDSTSIAWIGLDENDPNNIVPASMLRQASIVTGAGNDTFGNGICLDTNLYDQTNSAASVRRNYCDCQLYNGTNIKLDTWSLYDSHYRLRCKFDIPGSNQTFKGPVMYSFGESDKIQLCATSFNVTINEKNYDALSLNVTTGYCYDSKPYDYYKMWDRTRCLPDTTNLTYQWGFSTLLSGLFVFFHFIWAVSMYVVWQDAQIESSLVKNGYQMTPLRAAFAMAKAATRKTGLGQKQLVRANTKELEQELYGTRRSKGTKVEYGIFEAIDEEHGEVGNVRRRMARTEDSIELTEIPTSAASLSKPTVLS